MKLAVLSEIYANVEALQATLDAIAAHGVDRIVCLGDIVGHNTRPRKCIALLREAGATCVAGSYDRAVARQIKTETFSWPEARAIAWTREHLRKRDIAFLKNLPLKANIDNKLLAVHGALHLDAGCETARLDTDARLALSMAAELAVSGGTSRVFTWPGRGALAMTAIAQPPSCFSCITTRRTSCSRDPPRTRPACGW